MRNLKAKALTAAASVVATVTFFGLAANSAGASAGSPAAVEHPTPTPLVQVSNGPASRLSRTAQTAPASNFTPPATAPRARTRTRAS